MKPTIDLEPVFFGGTGFDSANQDMPGSLPERFEFGTMNTIGVVGLNAVSYTHLDVYKRQIYFNS